MMMTEQRGEAEAQEVHMKGALETGAQEKGAEAAAAETGDNATPLLTEEAVEERRTTHVLCMLPNSLVTPESLS